MIADMDRKMMSRGRVTIPIELRPRCELGWKAGTRLIVREVDDRLTPRSIPLLRTTFVLKRGEPAPPLHKP
jgi:bifunctional DNA-binding transcriptional regulator/antitoxin component of YhaV-PrlF toxin-antitoxin module